MVFREYPYINFSDYNLDWIIKTVKSMIDVVDSLEEWKQQHVAEYEELKAFMDRINAGVFPPDFERALHDWLQRNAVDIIGELATMVFFGLTDSGYFVAYIPESWDDLTFKTTGYDYITDLMPDYGHLTIVY